jgi:phosphate transport system substrate-binding protein
LPLDRIKIVVFQSKGLSLTSNRSRFGGFKTTKLNSKRVKALAGLAAVVPALIIPAAASAKVSIYGSGSSAAEPEAQALFAAYQKLHKNIVFHYNPDGGNAGVTDVVNGVSEFAIQTAAPSKTAKPTEWSELFLDGLCVDVNSANKLSKATIPQVADIFQSNPLFTTWGQVPGFKASSGLSGSKTILEEGRNSAAGQFTFFTQDVLNGGKENSSVSQLQTDGQVKVALTKNKNAIGYIGLANSSAKGEKDLQLAAAGGKTYYACDASNIKSEKYPLWRWDWSVLPANPNAQVVAFLKWVTDSKAAAKVINKAGGVAKLHKFAL